MWRCFLPCQVIERGHAERTLNDTRNFCVKGKTAMTVMRVVSCNFVKRNGLLGGGLPKYYLKALILHPSLFQTCCQKSLERYRYVREKGNRSCILIRKVKEPCVNCELHFFRRIFFSDFVINTTILAIGNMR